MFDQRNYAFSGALHPLSKLVLCAVMIRGRHRGLPLSLDRAIMLPNELLKSKDDNKEGTTSVPQNRRMDSERSEEIEMVRGYVE
jgi:hypothetical protein